MKLRKQTLALSLAVACAWIGGNAHAAGTHTININATVTGTCKFNTGLSNVSLTLDPTATTTVNSSPDNVYYRCTNGTVPSFDLTPATTGTGVTPIASLGASATGSGAGLLSNGTQTIPYTFSATGGGNGTGMGAGNDLTLAVTVSVDQTNAANVPAGSYLDTIAVNVNP